MGSGTGVVVGGGEAQMTSAAPGMVDTLREVYTREGLRGLYRGFLPNVMKAIPAVSIGYLVYEKFKVLLKVETVR